MDSETLPRLTLENITKRYGSAVALDGVSLTLRAGEVHALVGENGSGKSTLCNILHGEVDVTTSGGHSGVIRIDGEEVAINSPEDAHRHGIALVHQDVALVPQMTVAQNVTLGREPTKRPHPLSGVDAAAASASSRDALSGLGVSLDSNRVVGDLPIGMQQLVEAAREFSRMGVRILILDEPSAALSAAESDALAALMRQVASADTAVLFISHRLREVLAVADRVTVLRDGRVAGSLRADDASPEIVAQLMVGTATVGPRERAPLSMGDVSLTLEEFRVAMPGDPLRGLNLDVRAGEVVGVTSQAGHGRLAIASGLLGLFPAYGRLLVKGKDLPLGEVIRMEQGGLSVVHEDRRAVALDVRESIALNIAFPSLVAGRGFTRWPWLPGGGFPDRGEIRSVAEGLVERLDIRCGSVDQTVAHLSGGNQQKVAIARSIASSPAALVVSEPTRGIDVGAKATVLDALRAIADDGVAVLVVSGEVPELERICDRIVVLRDGVPGASFDPPFSSAEVELAVLGEFGAVRGDCPEVPPVEASP